MYLVRAKKEITFPDISGKDVKWLVNHSGLIGDHQIAEVVNNPSAWEIIAGPDFDQILRVKRTAPVRVALFGDSNADSGTYQLPINKQNEKVLGEYNVVSSAPFPASAATTLSVHQLHRWWVQRIYKLAKLVFLGGIGGSTTTQLLARDKSLETGSVTFTSNTGTCVGSNLVLNQAVELVGDTNTYYARTVAADTFQLSLTQNGAVATITNGTYTFNVQRRSTEDIVDADVDVIIQRGISINDLGVANNAAADTQVDTITWPNLRRILNRLGTAGVPVIVEAIPGFNNGSANTFPNEAATRYALLRLNNLLYAYCAASGGKFIAINPITAGYGQADGNFVAGDTNDGTHGNLSAGIKRDKALAAIFTSLFGVPQGNHYVGKNLITNANFSKTSSVAYGITADGFKFNLTGAGTRQNAQIEEIDGKVYQTVEFVNTSGANGIIIGPPLDITTGIAANDLFGYEFDFIITGLNGAALPNITGLTSRIDLKKTANGRLLNEVNVGTQISPTPSETVLKGTIVHPIFKVQEASANLTNNAGNGNLQFTVTTDGAGFKVGISEPRFVKLN